MLARHAVLALALFSGTILMADDAPGVVGAWKATKYNGETKEQAFLWTFAADGKFTLVAKDGEDIKYQAEGTYTVDASVTPNRIVLTVTKEDGDEKNDKYHGAFRAEKGSLLLKHSTDANPDSPDYPKTLDVEDDYDTYELVENK